MYKWPSIIKHNSKRTDKYYMDCQVVTAVNAYYVLTNKTIKQGTPKYHALCEEAGACYGSAISIGRVYNQLGLKTGFKLKRFHRDLKGVGTDYVLEVSVWHKECGFHSVAVIDSENNKLRVANFSWETSKDGWIDREKFETFVHVPPNPCHYASRKIKLD